MIAKVEVELKEEPSPEPPSGDLTPFAVGQTITAIGIDPTAKTNEEIETYLSGVEISEPIMAVSFTVGGTTADSVFVGLQQDDQGHKLIAVGVGNRACVWSPSNFDIEGVQVNRGWQYADDVSEEGQQMVYVPFTEPMTINTEPVTVANVESQFAFFNGIVIGAVEVKNKLLKAEIENADYTAHFKNGNTFPIDGTTFNQVTADFCQIGGAYYNPSIINRLYATNQPKYFVEFVNGQTLEITAQEYYDILGISGAKIEAGADLSVLFGNRAMDNAKVLAMLANLTYTDGKAVLATNSDGVELITAMNNSANGYQIVLYNEFMPIWTEKGYKGIPAGWCGTDTVVDGKQFTFVEADGTVKLAEYLQLFDVGEVDLTVATVTEGEWNPLLVGAIQKE